MRVERPLLKLPVRFCGDTLAAEVAALPERAWRPHPQRYDGNAAVPLVSPGGELTDEWAGPMAATEFLRSCPYVSQIMQELDATWGRSRLMALDPGSIVPDHVDIHYYWRTHLRIHIPAITNPGVAFTCAGETVHMQPGECWLLDSFFRHSVQNVGEQTRVHLVLDTVGSAHLWDLIEAAIAGSQEERFVPPGATPPRPLAFERVNAPTIMSPWEIKAHFDYLRQWTDADPQLDFLDRTLDRFLMEWSGTWARFGPSDEGLPDYTRHLADVQSTLSALKKPIMMRNDWGLRDSLNRFVFANAISPKKLPRPAQMSAVLAG